MAEYIDREAARDVLYDNDAITMLGVKLLNQIPAADVAPVRKAQWIGEADGYADGYLVYDTWYCSNCDYMYEGDEKPEWKYCPNCGARMDGAE